MDRAYSVSFFCHGYDHHQFIIHISVYCITHNPPRVSTWPGFVGLFSMNTSGDHSLGGSSEAYPPNLCTHFRILQLPQQQAMWVATLFLKIIFFVFVLCNLWKYKSNNYYYCTFLLQPISIHIHTFSVIHCNRSLFYLFQRQIHEKWYIPKLKNCWNNLILFNEVGT